MVFGGKVSKQGKFWIAESATLDAVTQGSTRAEAIEMLKDWIETAVPLKTLRVEIVDVDGWLTIETNENAAVIAVVLQRERQKSGLTVRELARRLGMKSHNSYAQYETGKSEPSISQLERFLSAMSPEKKLRFKIG